MNPSRDFVLNVFLNKSGLANFRSQMSSSLHCDGYTSILKDCCSLLKQAFFYNKPGLEAFEVQLKALPKSIYCFNENPTIADICLIPQVYNANRYGVDMSKYPIISRINANCLKLKAFYDAHPSKMIDAVVSNKL